MRTISVVVSFGLALVLAVSSGVGTAAHTGVTVGGLAIAIQPAWPGLEALQERDDFAGSYLDQERGGLVVYLSSDEADDAVEILEQHHEGSRFEVRTVAYSLAQLQAVQEEITARLDELRASGLDIRQIAVEVSANRVEIGASGQLAPVRAALADDAFAALIEPVDIGDRFEEDIFYDHEREVWFVGVCAEYRTKTGRWKAAVLDPVTGEVRRMVDRATGRHCHEGPWR